MQQGHHEALTLCVDTHVFSSLAAGRFDVDVRLPEQARPGDTIILEEVEGRAPTGRRIEATLAAVDSGSEGGLRHVHLRPKQSKYTPTA